MKKIAVLLASVLSLGFANAEPIEIASSDRSGNTWVMYPETFTRMQDGYTVLIAERDATAKTNENRMYAAVMRETCVNGHGSLYARQSPQEKWQLVTAVTLTAPTTIADVTVKVICAIGTRTDQRTPLEKRKQTTV